MTNEAVFEPILDFWFGELDEQGVADDAHSERWWKKDPEFDAQLRARFEATRADTLRGENDDCPQRPP